MKNNDFISVACIVQKDGKYLFCQREDNGLWELPGGRIEKGESPKQAALRELYEETGLIAKEAKFYTRWHFNLFTKKKTVGVFKVTGKVSGVLTPSWETPNVAFIDIRYTQIKIPKYVLNLIEETNNDNQAVDLTAEPVELNVLFRYIYGKVKRALR